MFNRGRPLILVVMGFGSIVVGGSARAHGPRDLPSEDKSAAEADGQTPPPDWYSLHYQFTGATQYHPAF